VTRERLIDAMSRLGPTTPVQRFMLVDVTVVSPSAPLQTAVEAIYRHPARAVAVADGAGRLLGYVNARNAAELYTLEQARRR
ncbi:MAG: CBS domain-containing protein, partial [Pseudomonadota bacterium]